MGDFQAKELLAMVGSGRAPACERRHARADRPLAVGQQVRVLGRDGLTLRVEPK
jgi:membrane-bound ClpP family serine protease